MSAADSPPPPPSCPNCRAVVAGEYCARCGQQQRPKTFTLAEMLHDVMHEIVHADGRLHHTAVSLLWRPGEFARDWFEGRRARHLPPFRSYIVVTVVLFLLLGAFGANWNLDARARADVARTDPIAIDTGLPKIDAALEARLAQQLDHFLREPTELASTVLDLAPQIGSMVVPLFALGLYALFRPQHLRYGHHLIAAVSLQTGVFVWLILAVLLQGIARAIGSLGVTTAEQWIAWPTELLLPGLLVYLLVGLRTVYGYAWPATLVRTLVLVLFYGLLAAFALSATLIVAFLVF